MQSLLLVTAVVKARSGQERWRGASPLISEDFKKHKYEASGLELHISLVL